MIEHVTGRHVNETLVGGGAVQSALLRHPAAGLQVGEMGNEATGLRFQFVTFQAGIKAGFQAGTGYGHQQAFQRLRQPFTAHEQHAADQAAIAGQTVLQMVFGQRHTQAGLPAVRTVAAPAAQRAAGEQIGQRYLAGHLLPDDLFRCETKLLHDPHHKARYLVVIRAQEH